MTIDLIIKESLREVIRLELQEIKTELQSLKDENQVLQRKLTLVLSKSNPEEVLTTTEVAAIMKVKESTVRVWCKNDSIEYEKSGSSYRIKRSAVEKYRNKSCSK